MGRIYASWLEARICLGLRQLLRNNTLQCRTCSVQQIEAVRWLFVVIDVLRVLNVLRV